MSGVLGRGPALGPPTRGGGAGNRPRQRATAAGTPRRCSCRPTRGSRDADVSTATSGEGSLGSCASTVSPWACAAECIPRRSRTTVLSTLRPTQAAITRRRGRCSRCRSGRSPSRSERSRCADLRVHHRPTYAFTIARNAHHLALSEAKVDDELVVPSGQSSDPEPDGLV